MGWTKPQSDYNLAKNSEPRIVEGTSGRSEYLQRAQRGNRESREYLERCLSSKITSEKRKSTRQKKNAKNSIN